MALSKGQAASDPVTGLAGRIYTAWTGNGAAGLTVNGTTRPIIAAMCEAIADAVIDEITTNARTQIGDEQIV